MTNVVQFRPAEFVNVHGKPISLSMKRLVLDLAPGLDVEHRKTKDHRGESDWFIVRAPLEYEGQTLTDRGAIATGATEEAAWRAAYFAIKQVPA